MYTYILVMVLSLVSCVVWAEEGAKKEELVPESIKEYVTVKGEPLTVEEVLALEDLVKIIESAAANQDVKFKVVVGKEFVTGRVEFSDPIADRKEKIQTRVVASIIPSEGENAKKAPLYLKMKCNKSEEQKIKCKARINRDYFREIAILAKAQRDYLAAKAALVAALESEKRD